MPQRRNTAPNQLNHSGVCQYLSAGRKPLSGQAWYRQESLIRCTQIRVKKPLKK